MSWEWGRRHGKVSTLILSSLTFSLAATPNFCSSSTTSKPRSLNKNVFIQQPVCANDNIYWFLPEVDLKFPCLERRFKAGNTNSVFTGKPSKRSFIV